MSLMINFDCSEKPEKWNYSFLPIIKLYFSSLLIKKKKQALC